MSSLTENRFSKDFIVAWSTFLFYDGQTPDPCKAPLQADRIRLQLHQRTWLQKIVYTQGNSNLKHEGNATKIKVLTTWANSLHDQHILI